MLRRYSMDVSESLSRKKKKEKLTDSETSLLIMRLLQHQ